MKCTPYRCSALCHYKCDKTSWTCINASVIQKARYTSYLARFISRVSMRPENENSLTHEKPSPNNAGAILFISGLVVKEVFLRIAFYSEFPTKKNSIFSQNIKWGASSLWSPSLYWPMRNSEKMTTGKMHPTLDGTVSNWFFRCDDKKRFWICVPPRQPFPE